MLQYQRTDILLSTIIGKVVQMRRRKIEAQAVKFPMEYDALSPLVEFHIRIKTLQPRNRSSGNIFKLVRLFEKFKIESKIVGNLL